MRVGLWSVITFVACGCAAKNAPADGAAVLWFGGDVHFGQHGHKLFDRLTLDGPLVVPPAPVIGQLPPPAVPAQPRGIVLATRQGARLVWGRPGEERFGVQPDEKVRDLVHTLKCQGDLSRIDSVNVRFHEPFYSLRASVSAPASTPR